MLQSVLPRASRVPFTSYATQDCIVFTCFHFIRDLAQHLSSWRRCPDPHALNNPFLVGSECPPVTTPWKIASQIRPWPEAKRENMFHRNLRSRGMMQSARRNSFGPKSHSIAAQIWKIYISEAWLHTASSGSGLSCVSCPFPVTALRFAGTLRLVNSEFKWSRW